MLMLVSPSCWFQPRRRPRVHQRWRPKTCARLTLLVTFVFALTATALVSKQARGQITDPQVALFPDPTKYARGLFVEAETGGTIFFGPVRTHLDPGFALGGRAGYDLARFFAVQVHLLGSTHLTAFTDEPHGQQLLQLYRALGEARFTLRAQSWGVIAQGGAGLAHTSTNVLQLAGLNRYRNSLAAGGGLGVDYHTLSRHVAVGLRADAYYLRDLAKSTDLTVAIYLRYTF